MIRFRDEVYRRNIPVTLEAPIIRTRDRMESFRDIFNEYSLGRWIIGINILNSPLGRPTPDPVIIGYLLQSEMDIEAIPHIPVSIENKYTLMRMLITASILGIRNLLVVGGDVKMDGVEYSDVVNTIRGFSDGYIDIGGSRYRVEENDFYIGGALIPGRAGEVERLIYKIGLGLRFFQTQIIFSGEYLIGLLESLLDGIGSDIVIPVLIGVAPYIDGRVMDILSGITLDEGSRRMLKRIRGEYLSHLIEVLSGVIDYFSGVNAIKIGIHIMPITWSSRVAESISILLEELA